MSFRCVTLLLSLVAISIGTGCPDPRYPLCKKDKHCNLDRGEKCVDGQCQNCTSDADCTGEGKLVECREFRCQEPEVPDSGEVPCSATAECTGGWVCTEGKCTSCTDDSQCAPSTCNLETGRCSNTGQCQSDDQCPMDEICDGDTCVFSGPNDDTPGPCGLEAVYFGFDDDTVGAKQAAELEALAKCIAEQGKNVILEAHADNVGTEEYNILLTERRGASVKKLLVDQGAPETLLQIVAKGALEASQEANEKARAEDRRVQFVWP